MIHSCSYYCPIPECIKAQRDELRGKLFNREWFGLTDEDIERLAKRARSKDHAITLAIRALKEKNA